MSARQMTMVFYERAGDSADHRGRWCGCMVEAPVTNSFAGNGRK